jgi:hypothetical protein
MQKWLSRAGTYRVEHMPLPYFAAAVDLDTPHKGVLHTTEGSTIEGALSAYRSKGFCPTFTLGKDAKGRVRILQHKALGQIGSTLMNQAGGVQTNALAIVQIEMVGFSKKYSWYPEPRVVDALLSLMVVLKTEAGIPLIWQAVRRSPGLWKKVSGWMGHIDVPENYHWDPGALDTSRLMAEAKARARIQNVSHNPRKKPRRVDAVYHIPLKHRAKKTPPAACGGPSRAL